MDYFLVGTLALMNQLWVLMLLLYKLVLAETCNIIPACPLSPFFPHAQLLWLSLFSKKVKSPGGKFCKEKKNLYVVFEMEVLESEGRKLRAREDLFLALNRV